MTLRLLVIKAGVELFEKAIPGLTLKVAERHSVASTSMRVGRANGVPTLLPTQPRIDVDADRVTLRLLVIEAGVELFEKSTPALTSKVAKRHSVASTSMRVG